MSAPSLVPAGWARVKQFAPAVTAAALMYAGLQQVITAFRYPVTGLILGLINAIIRNGFHDRILLTNYYGDAPWLFHAKTITLGVLIAVLGMFIGLFVNARNRARPTS